MPQFIQEWFTILLGFAVVLAIPVTMGFVGAAIGSRKNAAGPAFALGMFLGPIGWLLALLLDGRPKCPQCRERLELGAAVCWRCRTELAWPRPDAPTARTARPNVASMVSPPPLPWEARRN